MPLGEYQAAAMQVITGIINSRPATGVPGPISGATGAFRWSQQTGSGGAVPVNPSGSTGNTDQTFFDSSRVAKTSPVETRVAGPRAAPYIHI